MASGGANASWWPTARLAMAKNKEAVVTFIVLVELDLDNGRFMERLAVLFGLRLMVMG